ncbi:MAG: hypothetical protein J0L75_14610 [Spirochaetes bacterium]|nr:hypothetical protein [Spirochaetota bacterium]
MKTMRPLLLASLVFSVAFAAPARKSENYTNLFADDSQRLTQEIKKRSSTSVLESGTKIGAKLGFTYVFGENPTLQASAYADIPIARKFSVALEIGPVTAFPTNWTSATLTNTLGTNIIYGYGTMDYLMVTGTFKFFIESFWVAPGLSFYHFLRGSLVVPSTSALTSYKDDYYTIKNVPDDLYGVISLGYMAEIRENVFLMPELIGSLRLSQLTTAPVRAMVNVNFGLGFRL